MSTDERSRSRAGFTVVELVVALLVLAAGILGLAATTAVVASSMRVAHLETQVATRAQAEMESLLSSGVDRLAPGARRDGGLFLAWEVSGTDLRQLRLVVRRDLGPDLSADTLLTLVRAR